MYTNYSKLQESWLKENASCSKVKNKNIKSKMKSKNPFKHVCPPSFILVNSKMKKS